jgi:hypothetical protein
VSRKRVGQERFHVIFHLFLLTLLLAQCFSLSTAKIKNANADNDGIIGQGRNFLLKENSEITDEEIREQIRSIVDEIHARDASFLDGVDSVLVSRKDLDFLSNSSACNGHLLGAFSDDKIMIKESGKETNRRTLYHEAGHNVWKNLGEDKKEEWRTLFFSTERFVTPYASISAEEDFSESFACAMTDADGCPALDGKKRIFLEEIGN